MEMEETEVYGDAPPTFWICLDGDVLHSAKQFFELCWFLCGGVCSSSSCDGYYYYVL